jgi:hypothetical protein
MNEAVRLKAAKPEAALQVFAARFASSKNSWSKAVKSAVRRGPAPTETGQSVFKSPRAHTWTAERIAQLSVQDVKQLRANAERLNEVELVELCVAALKSAKGAQTAPRRFSPRAKGRKLIARSRAFEARGVWLQDPRTSWGGVRRSDGTIVLALWADGIESADGRCSYLLWRPNLEGERPWSDSAAGKERLEHCKKALEAGRAEGLLVYGQPLQGRLPEERAHTVYGVDPETVVNFKVERRDADYWAVWGKTTVAKRL